MSNFFNTTLKAGLNQLQNSNIYINLNSKLESGKTAPTLMKLELLDANNNVLGGKIDRNITNETQVVIPFTLFASTLNPKNATPSILKITLYKSDLKDGEMEVINVPYTSYINSVKGDGVAYNVDYKGLSEKSVGSTSLDGNKSSDGTNLNNQTDTSKSNKKKIIYIGLAILGVGILYYYLKSKKK